MQINLFINFIAETLDCKKVGNIFISFSHESWTAVFIALLEYIKWMFKLRGKLWTKIAYLEKTYYPGEAKITFIIWKNVSGNEYFILAITRIEILKRDVLTNYFTINMITDRMIDSNFSHCIMRTDYRVDLI